MKNVVLNERDSRLWEENKEWIYEKENRKKIKETFQKLVEEKEDQIIKEVGENWSTEGAGGWECEESPLKVCIYNFDYDDECCLYCRQPEERK